MLVEYLTKIMAGTSLCCSALIDRNSRAHLLAWLVSQLPKRSALKDGVPWLPYAATDWLSEYLTPQMSVFEYGAGGSTLFFSQRVNTVVCAEHDPHWHRQVVAKLESLGHRNWTASLVEPRGLSSARGAAANRRYTSSSPGYLGVTFYEYVRVVDAYPDCCFDLVVVDGRARTACLSHAVPKVRSGGYLLLDDSERAEYRNAFEGLAAYRRHDFNGICPYVKRRRYTSIWRKP